LNDHVSAKVGLGWKALATCLWIGYFPVAPATACSLAVTVVLGVVGGSGSAHLYWIVPLVALLGVPAASVAEREFGRDGKPIVIDEVLGQLVTFVAVPHSAGALVAGFLLFRFFDIVKPFPAHRSQRLISGVGVMTDDLVAGVYANIATRVLLWLF